VAAISPDPVAVDLSYEEFVRLHVERFTGYLRGMLGRQAEGRGGRVALDDTLQEALLAIYAEWPELRDVRDEERDRRLYRCLRDAAGQALRAEHGRRTQSGRPRIVSFDFGAMAVAGEDQPAHERELTAAVLGAMVRDMAAAEQDRDARATLDRGILIAGLRALTEREAVILIAVDHLGRDQHELAEQLGLGFSALRFTLFGARKVFYALVRHAAGVEVEDEERARLAAYLAGELTGPEKRETRRHLAHCRACQDLQREQRVFGRDACGMLAPLPFVFGAKALAKRSTSKVATIGGPGGGLFAQPGAAKAAAVVVGLLGVGVGTSAVLAELQEHHVHVGHRATAVSRPARAAATPSLKPPTAVASAAQETTGSAKIARSTAGASTAHRSRSSTAASSAQSQSPASAPTQTTTGAASQPSSAGQSPPPSKSKSSSGGSCEFFGC
jgi:DNA-directed RNA polymerase specialized sigma24 family protein